MKALVNGFFRDIDVNPERNSKWLCTEDHTYYKGYTLLEILAVITLIGLMAAIVFPVYTLREEKTEVNYIGNLAGTDFKSVQEEALCTQMEISVSFDKQGYEFKLGEAEIVRQFSQYKFSFKIPGQESEDSPSNSTVTTGEDDDSSEKPVMPELKFSKEGLSTGLTLQWETSHFSGTMAVDQDGVLKWNYGKKK